MNCTHCNIPFVLPYDKYNGPCHACVNFINLFHSNNLPNYDIHYGFYIEVIYNISIKEHDGYCSDQSNTKIAVVKKVINLQVPIIFTKNDIDDNDMIVGDKLVYFQDYKISDLGYCGCGKSYTFVSAKLKKKKPTAKQQLFG